MSGQQAAVAAGLIDQWTICLTGARIEFDLGQLGSLTHARLSPCRGKPRLGLFYACIAGMDLGYEPVEFRIPINRPPPIGWQRRRRRSGIAIKGSGNVHRRDRSVTGE